MDFLSKQQNYDATVLEMPSQNTSITDKSISDWYENSNPGITAYGNKRIFFNNEFIDFPGVDKNLHIAVLRDLLVLRDTDSKSLNFTQIKEKVKKDLDNHDVHFIFSAYAIPSILKIEGIEKIYSNAPYVLYKIGK